MTEAATADGRLAARGRRRWRPTPPPRWTPNCAAELAPAAERLGIEIEYRTVSGDPVTELSRIADALPADAVLVGASEQAGHRVIGSVAVRLVRMGHWPVTVVP